MLPIRTILHPTDFSENSQHAFHFACSMARDYGANLIVLHVYPTPVLPTMDGAVFPFPLDVPRDELLAMLNDIKPDDPAISVERLLVVGEPSYEIKRIAESYSADLIVMGTLGRSGLTRLVMGSVAEDVSRNADCPVLTVRSKSALAHEVRAKTAHEPAAVG
jgi:nucleotide-binding universal stress UspA family protein